MTTEPKADVRPSGVSDDRRPPCGGGPCGGGRAVRRWLCRARAVRASAVRWWPLRRGGDRAVPACAVRPVGCRLWGAGCGAPAVGRRPAGCRLWGAGLWGAGCGAPACGVPAVGRRAGHHGPLPAARTAGPASAENRQPGGRAAPMSEPATRATLKTPGDLQRRGGAVSSVGWTAPLLWTARSHGSRLGGSSQGLRHDHAFASADRHPRLRHGGSAPATPLGLAHCRPVSRQGPTAPPNEPLTTGWELTGDPGPVRWCQASGRSSRPF
jgi:hypothetical protein